MCTTTDIVFFGSVMDVTSLAFVHNTTDASQVGGDKLPETLTVCTFKSLPYVPSKRTRGSRDTPKAAGVSLNDPREPKRTI